MYTVLQPHDSHSCVDYEFTKWGKTLSADPWTLTAWVEFLRTLRIRNLRSRGFRISF